jgi:hypothetical protein
MTSKIHLARHAESIHNGLEEVQKLAGVLIPIV